MTEENTMEIVFPYFDYLRARTIEFDNQLNVKLYFDSSEIIDIVRGIDAFYKRGPEEITQKKFQKKDFESDKSFVNALAVRRLLNTIHLLPTHQAEFYDNYTGNGLDSLRDENTTLIETFRKSLDIEKSLTSLLKKPQKAAATRAELDKIFNDSKKLFKFLNACHVIKTSERLNRFFTDRKSKIFELTPYESDVYDIEDREIFNAISGAWSKIRPDGGKNNFYDSLALMRLINLVREFNSDNTKELPVFFDAAHKYKRVIEKAGIADIFIVKYRPDSENLYQYSVIRSCEYFEIFALLDAQKGDEHAVGDYRLIIQQHQEKVGVLLEALQNNEDKRELNIAISNYIHLDFIKEVILPCFTDGVLSILIKNLTENYSTSISQLREDINKNLKHALKALQSQTNELSNRYSVWTDIQERSFSLIMEEREAKSNPKNFPFSVVDDFSLMRFFIDNKNLNKIKEIFSDRALLASESKNYDVTLIGLFKLYQKYFSDETKGAKIEEAELYKIVTTLWVLSLYKHIKNIKVALNRLPTSLLMMMGASYLKDPTLIAENKIIKINAVIETLESKLPTLDMTDEENGKLHLAIAFLKFRIWKSQDSKLMSISHQIPEIIEDPILKGAFDNVQKAYELLKNSNDINAKLYSQNIYIYMNIDCGTSEMFDKIKPLVNTFRAEKSKHREYWHFRYDDTIARYHHRLSILLKQKNHYVQSITEAQNAEERIKLALEGRENRDKLRDVQEIKEYKENLSNYISDLYLSA